MISGSQAWQNDLAAGAKQPIYALQIPEFGIVLASSTALTSVGAGNPSVKKYYPGDYASDLQQTLNWLYSRQAGAIGNWLGNALATPTTPQFAECGLDCLPGFPPVPGQQLSGLPVENIVMGPNFFWTPDNSAGPDGFPINFDPRATFTTQIVNLIQNGALQATPLGGKCWNLQPSIGAGLGGYRIDLYSRTDKFYYQGSAWLNLIKSDYSADWQIPYGGSWAAGTGYALYAQIIDTNGNVQRVTVAGTSGSTQPAWNPTVSGNTTDGSVTWLNMGTNYANVGTLIAVLYAGGVPPNLGFSASTLPVGWVAHSNMGVGNKLQNYFARIYVKTDIEYLQEDNIPIIIQDGKHARVGSSVVPFPGTPTVHVFYQDPVVGNILVFTSLQNQAAYKDLVRSFSIPTSDPLYVSDVTKTNAPALQYRGFTYDQALAVIAFCAVGDYQAALKIIKQINFFLDNRGYLASLVLENAEDGSTARWTPSASGTVSNLNDPTEPPYGTGLVIKFHATATGTTFTYAGSGFPDTTDTMISFEHREPVPTSLVAGIAASPTGAVRSGGITTITTNAPHGFSSGDIVAIAGVTDISFDGTFAIGSVTPTTFTYIQTGQPNSTSGGGTATDLFVGGTQFLFDIGVTSSTGKVTDIRVNANPAAPATISGTIITVPIGPGTNLYHTTLLNLQSLISTLVSGENLSNITSFKVTLNYVGDMYFDNLSVGGLQPQDSLGFSYDIYYGRIDQDYIRAGAMAWVCYAYALYMQLSQDYSPALYLQRMINFIETLKSSASDLTNSLYYLGYGKYTDPGYAFTPGLIYRVSTEHQIDVFFAWKRAAAILPTAATELFKAGTITAAQQASLNTTATTVGSEATTIVNKVFTNLYIAPGALPGHFAQGAGGTQDPSPGLDTSQALDANSWGALFCHAAGDDGKALQLLKFAYQQFLISTQFILLSSAPPSWNQAYRQNAPFSGFKTYNDSPGGYSGSPVSVWQEGTWGMILALLDLYNVAGVQAYFISLGTTIDAVLTTLIKDQVTVKNTTATPSAGSSSGTISSLLDSGALLGWSLAARGLPWEFEVWPMFSPTAWWYVVAVNPSLLLSLFSSIQQNILPYLFIPPGSGQTVDELNGSSSIGTLSAESIDPSGTVKNLIAQGNLIGQVCELLVGFPDLAYSSYVTVETRQISATGWSPDGRIKIEAVDVQRFIMGAQAFLNGGPTAWTPGQPAPGQPSGAQWLSNAFPVGSNNPRYVQGNPLDIYLAVMQNELGVGQDPLLPRSAWVIYQPGQPGTLINPNTYLDVPGILNLQSGPFSGDWFEFKITSAQEGKQWLEDQILKPLGLFHIARANGLLALKSMKSAPIVGGNTMLTPVMAFTDKNIIGLPEVDRLPVINYLTIRFNVDYEQGESQREQKWAAEVTYQQATSITQYKQYFKHQIEATGLRIERGGLLRGFLMADRVFRRHAFATPRYKVKTQLSTLVVEVGDFVYLTHRLLPDLQTGQVGVNGVVCEVVDRKPNYAQGTMEFELLDTRFMSMTKPYQIAPLASGIPAWGNATLGQQQKYMFISLASMGGENPDGTLGNTIF